MTTSYTLQELNGFVRGAIEATLPAQYWLTAELASVSERGHMYCDFVQKDSAGRTIATARGNSWQNTWRRLAQKFAEATGGSLAPGMQVMVMVRATFSEIYGFSYNIIDIEPSFTLGDMARRRAEILKRLEQDGIMHCNQELPLPRLMQRIAIVSAPTAAGYGDFVKQLLAAPQHYRFTIELFASPMQGEGTEAGVLAALERIMARQDDFDAVVIIRGGGSVTDLACFDSYAMAQAVALFPLPVFTGIGHERDEVVLDFVAHTRLKTPTAVAAFLLSHLDATAQQLTDTQRRIVTGIAERIQAEHTRLAMLSVKLPRAFGMVQQRELHRIAMAIERMRRSIQLCIQREQHRMALLSNRLDALDPIHTLRRGYSMTTCDGRLVTSVAQLTHGTVITTHLADGNIASEVL